MMYKCQCVLTIIKLYVKKQNKTIIVFWSTHNMNLFSQQMYILKDQIKYWYIFL